jgi:hypothetical protein
MPYEGGALPAIKVLHRYRDWLIMPADNVEVRSPEPTQVSVHLNPLGMLPGFDLLHL